MGFKFKDIWRITPVGAVVTLGGVVSNQANSALGSGGQQQPSGATSQSQPASGGQVEQPKKKTDWVLWGAIGVGVIALTIITISLVRNK